MTLVSLKFPFLLWPLASHSTLAYVNRENKAVAGDMPFAANLAVRKDTDGGTSRRRWKNWTWEPMMKSKFARNHLFFD